MSEAKEKFGDAACSDVELEFLEAYKAAPTFAAIVSNGKVDHGKLVQSLRLSDALKSLAKDIEARRCQRAATE
jgi:hypothetical protein